MIDIKPQHMTVLASIFQLHAPTMHLWAYGSRVTGLGHDASDLDLVVRHESALETPFGKLAELRAAIEDSPLPFLVDLHDWALLTDDIRQQILKNYVVLSTPGDARLPQKPGGDAKQPINAMDFE